MRIAIGSDREGVELKERLKLRFNARRHGIEDVCRSDADPGDYHHVTDRLASAIRSGRVERGVLICSSAIGASIAANKHPGVRAAICREPFSAQRGVQDENMNLLVLETRAVTPELACQLAEIFINERNATQTFGIPPHRLARVIEHTKSNLHRPIEVSELASVAGMSESHFSKLFKISTGLTPHRFLVQERINRSMELLREGKVKIVEIALAVGFQNQAHFTTVFGAIVGLTPGQFQRSSYKRLVDKIIATDATIILTPASKRVRMNQAGSGDQHCGAVISGGGEGARLRSLTTGIPGTDATKHFGGLLGP